jgi:hypothetical protein
MKFSFRGRFAMLAACFSFLFFATGNALSQDLQKTYRIGPGGSINIHSVSGNIEMEAYDGDGVQVSAFKEGRDRDQVEIEDLSDGNSVNFRTHYPQHCNCDASVRFTVRVPRGVEYNIDQLSSASGNIEVKGIKGTVHARSASGDVKIEDAAGAINASTASGEVQVKNVVGSVNARSASGNVEVELTRIEGAENMSFSTASGDVHVKAPSNLDAFVEMTSSSGSINTDFPIEIRKRRYGSGASASGQLGTGSRTVHISSASGNVTLAKL